MTFKEKILEYFSTHNIGKSAKTFAAFNIIVRCLNYNINGHFAYTLCGLSPQQDRKLHYNILMRKIKKLPQAYCPNNVNGIILFFMFIDLDVRLSKDICQTISYYLNKVEYKKFDHLCQIYFSAIKSGIISNILSLEEGQRVLYFLKEYGTNYFITKGVCRELGIKNSILQKSIKRNSLNKRGYSFYDNIGSFDPQYINSKVWGDVITHRIKSIPMGGQNKKY